MSLELLELYPSPFSERVRWVLELKRVPYRRRGYQPLAGEVELREQTGQTTVPVFFADGALIGDSNAAVEWIETHHPAPPLVPSDPTQRLQVRAVELAATEALAPWARLGFIGRAKAMELQPLADHFAAKYGWSPQREASAGKVLRALLDDLTQTVATRPHLVGDALSRADVTVAAMLATVFGHPPDDLFELDAAMRPMFGLPAATSRSWSRCAAGATISTAATAAAVSRPFEGRLQRPGSRGTCGRRRREASPGEVGRQEIQDAVSRRHAP